MKIAYTLIASLLAGAVTAAAPTVTVASGVLVGTTTKYPGATATNNKYLGIPYAKSPPLRFAPPQAAAKWSTPIQATKYKNGCLQQGNVTTPPGGQSEDCLYANVFTPPGTNATSAKPVMLWVFGGDLMFGDASVTFYDGSYLAAQDDVIVVTFNYRTNVFGFSNSPSISTDQQNVGFLDQRFFLNWVQTNIAAFGGDPTKVTLFSESAGAASVKFLLALPQSNPPPYRAGIMESEAIFIPADGSASWSTLAAQLGCPTDASGLACMRAANATKIQSIITSQNLGFPPVIDGKTYTDDAGVAQAYSNKTGANVPVLIGTNGQELSAIPHDLGLDGSSTATLGSILQSFLGNNMGSNLTNHLANYSSTNVVFNVATQVFTQLIFQCPAATLASEIQNRGPPVWRYYYNASFPNSQPFQGAGAYHSSEIPEVFGTYTRAGDTAQQIGLATYMTGAWSTFAKNPTGGPDPAWPKYGSNHQVGALGANGSTGETTISASSIDTLCPIFDLLGGVTKILESVDGTSDAAKALNQALANIL